MKIVPDDPGLAVWPAAISARAIDDRWFAEDGLDREAQQRVLALLFTHPERSFYTSEIVRNADVRRLYLRESFTL